LTQAIIRKMALQYVQHHRFWSFDNPYLISQILQNKRINQE